MANSVSRWQKKNTVLITLRLNNYSDVDIIKFLNTVDNKSGLIKELLRKEMQDKNFVCPHPTKKEVDAYEEYLLGLEEGKVGDYERKE